MATNATGGAAAKANPAKARMPKIGRHSSGQARMTLAGRVHYLGEFGSPESLTRAGELWGKFLAGGSKPLVQAPHGGQVLLSVADLGAQYRAWLDQTHKFEKDGRRTSQRELVERALVQFEAVAGHVRAVRLTEAVLVMFRDSLEGDAGLTRGGINRKLRLVLGMLAWARERGLLTREAWADASAVEPLRRGRVGDRRERGKAKVALPFDVIEKVAAACVCRHVAAMVRLQALLGCRPGEACALRWKDVDKAPEGGDGSCWLYVVHGAKSDHHDKATSYWLPQAAQELLAEFPAPPLAFVFSPASSMAERGRARKNAKPFGPKWTTHEYRQALRRACVAAGVEPFGPHTIRHSVLTWIANAHGVVAASRVANHSSVRTTARYVHASDADALAVAAAVQRRVGG